MTHPEDDLMSRYRDGDDAAFTALHPLASSIIHSLARGHGLNHNDADDLTSEVLLRVVARRHTFEPGRAFRPWVRRIARNRIADLWRARQRHPETLSGPIGGREDDEDFVSLFESREANPLEAAIVAEDVSRAKACLSRLPERQSEALWRFCCGEQLREISESVLCHLSEVKRRSLSARCQIRRMLDVA